MKLATAQRAQILTMLCEGVSMRATSPMCDVSINTVTKLLEDAGEVCLDLHDELVRNVKSKRVEVDELWSFVHTKAKNLPKAKSQSVEYGDCWTWTAIDGDSKLMISYLAGQRTAVSAEAFTRDIASRVSDRIQITSDGFPAYTPSIQKAFGGAVDHAMLIKIYANVPAPGQTRYSPLEIIGTKREIVSGNPDASKISTSYVERMNLTLRMSQRRYTRLTNGHSKKYANHLYSLATYIMFYNFCRIHKSLRVTPAMAAGIADHVWSMEEIVARMEAVAPKPGPKGPRRNRSVEN
jgi:IS1 family transposase